MGWPDQRTDALTKPALGPQRTCTLGEELAPFAGNRGARAVGVGPTNQTITRSGHTGRARLKLAVAEQTGNDYVVARAEHTGIVGKGVARVRNLSFDVLTSTYVGAGSPRISVEVDTTGDGDADVYAYLAAFHCSEAIPGSNWARADFTGRISAGCDLYASDQAGPYASTGTQSAWAVFAAAHPGATVIDAYVVADEVGQSYIDNLAFQRHVFTGKGRMAECTTEASC